MIWRDGTRSTILICSNVATRNLSLTGALDANTQLDLHHPLATGRDQRGGSWWRSAIVAVVVMMMMMAAATVVVLSVVHTCPADLQGLLGSLRVVRS